MEWMRVGALSLPQVSNVCLSGLSKLLGLSREAWGSILERDVPSDVGENERLKSPTPPTKNECATLNNRLLTLVTKDIGFAFGA